MGASFSIDHLIQAMKGYLPQVDEGRLKQAYDFAKRAHEGQVRFSGEPYIVHPLETAAILLPLKPDEDTLVAALLHDVPSETSVPLKAIEQAFDRPVAQLVSAVDKLSVIKMQSGTSQVDIWRKMVMAMAKDLRVVFIKLAERLHNMRTLEHVATEKRSRIAEETLRVYAPIASRLGLYFLKSELEDLSFRFLYPREYEALRQQLEDHGHAHQKTFSEAQAVLEDFLKEEGITGEVSGRLKHLYSIYQKLQKKNANTLSSVYDLFAMRIVLPDQSRDGNEFVGHCYTTLGALHNRWTPMPGRFKDYIAVAKLNGYRSLHTTVIGVVPSIPCQPLEVQIRTQTMHRESEYGVASHWWYEDSRRTSTEFNQDEVERLVQGRRLLHQLHQILEDFPAERSQFERFFSPQSNPDRALESVVERFLNQHGFSTSDRALLMDFLKTPFRLDARLTTLQHQLDWLYGLQSLAELSFDGEEAEDLSIDLFEDRIFVLTPNGDVKDLPVGATPVDFAYAIHTDVGHRCHQVRVNGSIASLRQPLLSGDVVEIISKKDPQPNRYWLSFVKTTLAKTKVKAWFRTVDREKNIREGRDLLNTELKRLGKPLLGPNYQLLERYGGKPLPYADREHVVELVGNGTLTVQHVLRNLFSEAELMGPRVTRRSIHIPQIVPTPPKDARSSILVTGESNLPLTLSTCCKPQFPQTIVGYVTRGKSLRIHQTTCVQLDRVPPERLLSARWAAIPEESRYTVRLRLVSQDRVGLLRDILSVATDLRMNVVDFPLISKQRDRVKRDLILDVLCYEDLARLLPVLEAVAGVFSVELRRDSTLKG